MIIFAIFDYLNLMKLLVYTLRLVREKAVTMDNYQIYINTYI